MQSSDIRSSTGFLNFTIVLSHVVLFASITMPICCNAQNFTDVPRDHWAYDAVLELKSKGILVGYPNGTFKVAALKTTPKTTMPYDLTSPRNTWRSLLRAMRDGDEDGISHILTSKCLLDDVRFVRIRSISNDRSLRIRAYRKLEELWRTLTFVDLNKGREAEANLFQGAFSGDIEPPIGTVYYITMEKKD